MVFLMTDNCIIVQKAVLYFDFDCQLILCEIVNFIKNQISNNSNQYTIEKLYKLR